MNTNVMEYENALIGWINDLITERYNLEKENYNNIEEYLCEKLYFVTLIFDKEKVRLKYQSNNDALPKGSVEFRQFNSIYNLVCRRVLGRNYNKSLDTEKPLSVVCMDANGSRYWAEMGDVENIHLHSIWIMDSKVKDAFDQVLENVKSKDKAFDISNVDVSTYTGDASRLISYAFKFDKFTRMDASIASTFMIYPNKNKL